MQELTPTDPLLMACRKALAVEAGVSHVGEGQVEELIAQLSEKSFLYKKGPHVSTSRWFAWFEAMRWLLPQWSSIRCALVVVGLQEGLLMQGGR